MRIHDKIEVRNNLSITARERGKIVTRRDGHNIWVDLGREYLAGLISLASQVPEVPNRNDRIKYMGFGIGGTRQLIPDLANGEPLVSAYPGGNAQTDTDPTVTTLERPVRISGSTTGPSDPYAVTDVWLGAVQAPVTFPTATQVMFRRFFPQTEISYGPFTSVPVSEIGLFTSDASPTGEPHNTLVAYDTFDSMPKTGSVEFEVEWVIRF